LAAETWARPLPPVNAPSPADAEHRETGRFGYLRERREIYGDLARKISDSVLKTPIDSFYPIEDIKAALTRAQQGGRNGKVLVLQNGPLH